MASVTIYEVVVIGFALFTGQWIIAAVGTVVILVVFAIVNIFD